MKVSMQKKRTIETIVAKKKWVPAQLNGKN